MAVEFLGGRSDADAGYGNESRYGHQGKYSEKEKRSYGVFTDACQGKNKCQFVNLINYIEFRVCSDTKYLEHDNVRLKTHLYLTHTYLMIFLAVAVDNYSLIYI